MKKIETHYDILKVARDAPLEVIRAAYRSLSQKYHPDKNQGSPDAERIMQLINLAYQILSDPERRKEHDQWIAEQEESNNKESQNYDTKNQTKTQEKNKQPNKEKAENEKIKENKKNHPWRRFFARTVDVAFIGSILFLLFIYIVSPLIPYSILISVLPFLENPVTSGIIIYLLWVPVEAIFLSMVGSTPAKWIFGIGIFNEDGSKLSYSNALKRTLHVFFQGEGLGIPIAIIVTRIISYLKLEKTGTTAWDTSVGSVVNHKKWGFLRATASVLVVLLTLILIGVLNSLSNKKDITKSYNFPPTAETIQNTYQPYELQNQYSPKQQTNESNIEQLNSYQNTNLYSQNLPAPPISLTVSQTQAPQNIPQEMKQLQSQAPQNIPQEVTQPQSQAPQNISQEMTQPQTQASYQEDQKTEDNLAPLLLPIASENSKFKVIVKMVRANVRTTSTTGNNILGTVKQGDQLSVIGSDGDYYLISTSMGKGFIHKSTVQNPNFSDANIVNRTANIQTKESSITSLSSDDKNAIEIACITHKSQDAAAYRSCLTNQMNQLEETEPVNLSHLPFDDKSAIEMACIYQKSQGAAAYRSCLKAQLNQLNGTVSVNLDHLPFDDKSAIEMACIYQKSQGAAAYRSCLKAQLNQLEGTEPANLNHLSFDDKSAIEMACIYQKSQGAAAYRICLQNQLNQLKYPF